MVITPVSIESDLNRISNSSDSKNADRELPYKAYHKRIVKQSKKLSQLIVKSWYHNPPHDATSAELDFYEQAKKIRTIFLNFNNTNYQTEANSGTITKARKDMEELLTGQKPELFKGSVFTEEEIKDYLIQIDWNSFEGSVRDAHQQSTEQKPPYFILTLPYPPRTYEFESQMKSKVLREWIEQEVHVDSVDPEQEAKELKNPFPPLPYLPQTST